MTTEPIRGVWLVSGKSGSRQWISRADAKKLDSMLRDDRATNSGKRTRRVSDEDVRMEV